MIHCYRCSRQAKLASRPIKRIFTANIIRRQYCDYLWPDLEGFFRIFLEQDENQNSRYRLLISKLKVLSNYKLEIFKPLASPLNASKRTSRWEKKLHSLEAGEETDQKWSWAGMEVAGGWENSPRVPGRPIFLHSGICYHTDYGLALCGKKMVTGEGGLPSRSELLHRRVEEWEWSERDWAHTGVAPQPQAQILCIVVWSAELTSFYCLPLPPHKYQEHSWE